ncbi:MAG: large conductance mechanosensitive channel protein MscL [Candidatus Saccharimonadales bacterium]
MEKPEILKDFKKFILRGNVVDLAVAVVIGAAFGKIITALVSDFITPLIASIYSSSSFAKDYFTFNGSKFMYGDFVNAIITFVIIAAVIFFLIIQPINKLHARAERRKTPLEPTDRACPECLSLVPKAASRCAFCTAKIKPQS